MPKPLSPLYSFSAKGKVGGHRRGRGLRAPAAPLPEMFITCLLQADTSMSAVWGALTTSYTAPVNFRFTIPQPPVPLTHFRIFGIFYAQYYPRAVYLQLANFATPQTPLTLTGDDYVNASTPTFVDSGWKELASPITSDLDAVIAAKILPTAGNAYYRSLFLAFK